MNIPIKINKRKVDLIKGNFKKREKQNHKREIILTIPRKGKEISIGKILIGMAILRTSVGRFILKKKPIEKILLRRRVLWSLRVKV